MLGEPVWILKAPAHHCSSTRLPVLRGAQKEVLQQVQAEGRAALPSKSKDPADLMLLEPAVANRKARGKL